MVGCMLKMCQLSPSHIHPIHENHFVCSLVNARSNLKSFNSTRPEINKKIQHPISLSKHPCDPKVTKMHTKMGAIKV